MYQGTLDRPHGIMSAAPTLFEDGTSLLLAPRSVTTARQLLFINVRRRPAYLAEQAGRAPGRLIEGHGGGSCNDGGWGSVPLGCSGHTAGDWTAY